MATTVLIGYDGSPEAAAAIAAGAQLFPGAHAHVAFIWTPPFASDGLRRRLRASARDADDLVASIEREGQREAAAIAEAGAALARAAGWDAEPRFEKSFSADGVTLTQLAERVSADVVVVGARGLTGAEAVLGSVSDTAVRYARGPVLVVPHPLLADEFAALSSGPILVGYDSSAGAEQAAAVARRLFPGRRLLAAVAGREAAEAASSGSDSGVAGLDTVRVNADDRLGSRATADALIGCAQHHDAGVLVVGSRGRSAVREVLLGSVAVATLRRSPRPVLVVRG